MTKISVLIPCFNEEKAIASVIKQFPVEQLRRLGYDLEIIVIDNNSSDRTSAIAEKLGAKVIHEAKQGKGRAIQTGFYSISADSDYVVMLDGDNTYSPREILRLIEPIQSGFADAIVGSRMAGRMEETSMSAFNHLGNWFFSFLVRIIYKVNVTDVLTGYFAWSRDAAIMLRPHIKSPGFAVEMEMITKMARLDLDVYSVPITYDSRLGESSLRPLHDGAAILNMFLRQLSWKPRAERFAFVTDAVYPFNKGGKERRLYEIVKRLVAEDREIHIYTMKWWEGPRTIIMEGVYYHGICKVRSVYATNKKRSISQAVLYSLSCFKLLTQKFDVLDVDQIPVFPLFTLRLVCWMRRKKMYTTWYEVWGKNYWKEYLGVMGYFGWLLEYMSLKLPDVIISISRHTTDSLVKAGVKKDIRTIPLGVDLSLILSAPVSNVDSDMIYVGRLLSHKNVDMLIRAVAKLKSNKPDISCVIVGEGPEQEKLESLAKDLDLNSNVTFMKFIENSSELYGIMKASKVFVFPSNREGFGLIALEANAAGLPVLTLDHPNNAATDLIRHGKNGYLFKDEKALVRLLNRYFADDSNKGVSANLGEYSWNQTADLVQEVYAS
jgi:glycosyltransferase involved in cell wall biosynthesis